MTANPRHGRFRINNKVFLLVSAHVLQMALSASTVQFCIAQENTSSSNQAVDILRKGEHSFAIALAAAEEDFRLDLARAVEFADRIEILLIEFDLENEKVKDGIFDIGVGGVENGWKDTSKRFAIKPYRKLTPVLRVVQVTRNSELWQHLITAIQQSITNVDPQTNALSHFPTHALRVFSGDELIFESSYCFASESFFIDYSKYSRWHDVSGRQLSEVVKRIAPMPVEYERKLDTYLGRKKSK